MTNKERKRCLADCIRLLDRSGETAEYRTRHAHGMERTLTRGAVTAVVDAAVAGDIHMVYEHAQWLADCHAVAGGRADGHHRPADPGYGRLLDLKEHETVDPWPELILCLSDLVWAIGDRERKGRPSDPRRWRGELAIGPTPDQIAREWAAHDDVIAAADHAVELQVGRLRQIVVDAGVRHLERHVKEWGMWCDRWPTLAPEVERLCIERCERKAAAAAAAVVMDDRVAAQRREWDRQEAERAAREGPGWGVRFLTMFSMSEDSWRFKTAEELESAGYTRDGNVYRAPDDKEAIERLNRETEEAGREYRRLSRRGYQAKPEKATPHFPGETR